MSALSLEIHKKQLCECKKYNRGNRLLKKKAKFSYSTEIRNLMSNIVAKEGEESNPFEKKKINADQNINFFIIHFLKDSQLSEK